MSCALRLQVCCNPWRIASVMIKDLLRAAAVAVLLRDHGR